MYQTIFIVKHRKGRLSRLLKEANISYRIIDETEKGLVAITSHEIKLDKAVRRIIMECNKETKIYWATCKLLRIK